MTKSALLNLMDDTDRHDLIRQSGRLALLRSRRLCKTFNLKPLHRMPKALHTSFNGGN